MELDQLNTHKQKKLILTQTFNHFTKINSKWITDLNVNCKTMKLLEDNMGENLDGLRFGDDCLDTTPKAQSMKEIIDKLDFNLIRNFCSVKGTFKRMRRQATD